MQAKHSYLVRMSQFIFLEVIEISLYSNYNMYRMLQGIHTKTLYDVLPKFMIQLQPQFFTLLHFFKLIFRLLLVAFILNQF